MDKKEIKKLIRYINNKKCNCTWECAIQTSEVFNWKKYPAMLFESFFKKL